MGVTPGRLRQVAEAALQFTIRSSKGQTVRLTFDKERRDDYGRLLAYVHLPDGRLLNRLLLEKGYAGVYRRADFRLKEDFLAAEAAAREGKRGLWQ
jgi:micrococcal nuclease